ncbi:MAG: hypothetical protein EB026_06985, partial [Betaproteobacteria bacterium]|nr:hypothetical protein [Betaproteobacteria bacterium]
AFCLLGPFGSNAQCLRATLFRAMATFAVSAFFSAGDFTSLAFASGYADPKALTAKVAMARNNVARRH